MILKSQGLLDLSRNDEELERMRLLREMLDKSPLLNDVKVETPEKEQSEEVAIEYEQRDGKARKKNSVKSRKKIITELNQWPYSDSYAPKLKLIADDNPKFKERLRLSTVKGALGYDQLKIRKADISKVEDQYREKMKEAAKMRKEVREITKEWSTEKTVVIDKIPTVHSYARVLVGGALTREMGTSSSTKSVEYR